MGKRKIVDNDCDYILSDLSRVVAGTKDISIKIASEINYVNKLQLRDFEIHPEIIEDMKKEYYRQYRKSVIQPGKAIGMVSAASIGAPMTQLNLNTFHQVGSAKSVGIDAFKELFNGTAIRKDESTILHFVNKNLTFEDVLEYRRHIIGISIGSLILKKPEVMTTTLEDNEWWYDLYSKIVGKKDMSSSHFLRLEFNLNLLYKYRITLSDIVNKIESLAQIKIVNCIPSPIHIGIIDVYPITSKIMEVISNTGDNIGVLAENSSVIYLQQIFIPNLDTLLIKGIKNIRNLFPISINIYSLFINEEMKIDGTWILWLDLIKIRTYGVGIKKIFSYLENAGFNVLNKAKILPDKEWEEKDFFTSETNGRYVHISMPKIIDSISKDKKTVTIYYSSSLLLNILEKNKIKYIEKNDNYVIIPYMDNPMKILEKNSPLDFLNNKLKFEEDEIKVWINQERSKGVILPKYKYSDFYKSSKYVYCELVGSNLKQLLSLPFVDSKNTISNNPHEILDTFGIETCRNYISLNFYQMLNDTGSYIYPGYIYLIPDFMTNKGIIIAMTSKGITKFERGAFADSSFQEPFVHFTKAAMTGKKELVIPTSSCIFTGKRIPIGTGLPKLICVNAILSELFKLTKNDETDSDSKYSGGLPVMKEDMTLNDKDNTFEEKIKKLSKKIKTVPPNLANNVYVVKKGPVPLIIKTIDNSPQILENILNFEKRNLLIPKLAGLNIREALEKISKNITNQENKVKKIDIEMYVNNINNYI